ncbi:hypothetical protein ACLQ91_09270, partial [Avibacterium endocarditidis]
NLLKINIKKSSNKILKRAKSRLELVRNKRNYINLDKKEGYISALVSELFRDPNISKNSNDLWLIEIQRKVLENLHKENFELSINWGQAKRSCGKLKTDSYYSDFSELYAIASLQTLIEAISIILGKNVVITIRSGGERFSQALFTDKEKLAEYDKQRQILADLVSSNNKIIIKPYTVDKDICSRKLVSIANEIPHSVINNNFHTILLNIDWENIIKNKISPHDINIPNSIFYLVEKGWGIDDIIVMAIFAIFRPDSSSFWVRKLPVGIDFDEIINFFYLVASESTKKYIAIHLIGYRKINKIVDDKGYLRITVHAKRNCSDIPAIYLLNKESRNKLPQHNCTLLDNNEIYFLSKIEMTLSREKYKAIYIDDVRMNWFSKENTPLMYVRKDNDSYLKMLANIDFF